MSEMNDPVNEYERRYGSYLQAVAASLRAHIEGYLVGVRNVDRVTARAKEPGRFAEKARRTDERGHAKYQKPLTEIQDQLGARVIVFYREDVVTVGGIVTRYFQAIEQRDLVPESQWAFGYFGQHFVLPTPRDVVPAGVHVEEVPRFFELQIKTLFQHAWSEANHDLGYKAQEPLSMDQERRLAFTAAQAWGADRIFAELRAELVR
jgi:ppGpp synthetase/RelA/SpoT-type nucleotidyltranferase